MIPLFLTLLSSLNFAHADAFEARVMVASVHKHQALVSLTNKDLMVFGQCELPVYYEPKRDLAPIEAFVNCRQIGESLPNKPAVRSKLEQVFKTKLSTTFDDATTTSPGTIARRGSVLGLGSGAAMSLAAYFFFPQLKLGQLAGIFGGFAVIGGGGFAYVAARSAYAINGSAEVLAEIDRSAVMTSLSRPLVVEDVSELGLISRHGFNLARTALNEAVAAVAFELRGIMPGGGSAGGAGASSTW